LSWRIENSTTEPEQWLRISATRSSSAFSTAVPVPRHGLDHDALHRRELFH
jgi:hypothetical protein